MDELILPSDKLSGFLEAKRIKLPYVPISQLGCCGILATSLFANCEFNEVWEYIGRGHRGNWKGGTTREERREFLVHKGVEFSEINLERDALSLRSFAKYFAKLGSIYMIEVPRHVVFVDEFGTIHDQSGPGAWSEHRSAKERVEVIWERKS